MAKYHRDFGIALVAVGFGILGQALYELIVSAMQFYLFHVQLGSDYGLRVPAGTVVAAFFVVLGLCEMKKNEPHQKLPVKEPTTR